MSKWFFKVGAFNFYPGIFQDTDGMVKGFYIDALNETGETYLLTSVAITEERLNYLTPHFLTITAWYKLKNI